MKTKLSIVFIFICASTIALFSQAQSNFSIGPKLGVNFSNISSDNTQTVPGIAFGITSTYSFLESNGLGLDLLYSSQGFKTDNSVTKLNYIKIPVMYKLFFNSLGEAFRPRIEVGFSPGFLINAKNGETIITDSYEKFVIGLIGGVGFNYRLTNRTWLNTDLRADYGLTKIRPNSENLENRNVNLNVGIAYGL